MGNGWNKGVRDTALQYVVRRALGQKAKYAMRRSST